MKAMLFSNFILLLFFVIVTVFYHFKNHFSGVQYFQAKAHLLEKQIESEQLKSILAFHQLSELKQHVAEVLPAPNTRQFKRTEEGFAIRDLASVIGISHLEKFNYEQASTLFEQAKTQFRKKQYDQAIGSFEKITSQYNDSIHVVKSYFLLVECFFQTQDYDRLIRTVDTMVTHYPESEMTGFALLRLGSVYEHEERPEDAIDIYKVVLKNYRDSTLRSQANYQLEAIHL